MDELEGNIQGLCRALVCVIPLATILCGHLINAGTPDQKVAASVSIASQKELIFY